MPWNHTLDPQTRRQRTRWLLPLATLVAILALCVMLGDLLGLF